MLVKPMRWPDMSADARYTVLAEYFSDAMAKAIIQGFITPEDVKQYVALEDLEPIELALLKELDKIDNVTDPNWKLPNLIT